MERSGKGTSDEGWWQASDGRWYPQGMAHHPAARAGVAGPGTPPRDGACPGDGRSRRSSWRAWAILLLPLLTLLLLVLAAVDAASDPTDVDAAANSDPVGPGPLSPDGVVTTTSTVPPTTTPPPPDLTMTSAGPAPQRPPPVPPVSVTAPSTTGPAAAERLPSSSTSTAAPPSSAPTSRDDCKHGGWRTLVDPDGRPFRNQGDCVSSVSSG
jgi:hypothetical protein